MKEQEIKEVYSFESRHAVIKYEHAPVVTVLDKRLKLPRKLKRFFNKDFAMTREVLKAKIDLIFEKVEAELDMLIEDKNLAIYVLGTQSDLQDKHIELYGKSCACKSFYSAARGTIYIASVNATCAILAREIAHFILDSYFDKAVPSKVQELLVQYTEKRLGK